MSDRVGIDRALRFQDDTDVQIQRGQAAYHWEGVDIRCRTGATEQSATEPGSKHHRARQKLIPNKANLNKLSLEKARLTPSKTKLTPIKAKLTPSKAKLDKVSPNKAKLTPSKANLAQGTHLFGTYLAS